MSTYLRKLFIAAICMFLMFSQLANAQDQAANSQRGYQRIIKSGTLRVGVSLDYPPLNFRAGEKGVDVELARKLASFLNVKSELLPMPVSEYIPAIVHGKVDILFAGLSRNLERGKKIWFSVPYLTITPAVLVNKSIIPQTRFGEIFEQVPFSTIWDIKRLTRFSFAVKKGSAYETLLSNEFPDMQKITVNSNKQGLELLKNGKVQGFVHDSLYLERLLYEQSDLRAKFSLLKGGSRKEKLCVGLPFGDVVLKNQVDLFIEECLRQGIIDKLMEKYNEQN